MRSPHRARADAGEAFLRLVFGELVRAIDRDVEVRADETIRLPRTGRWETGLARLRPALDDALGATALAVAWRWASAERDENAWPSFELVARKATDRTVRAGPMDELARYDGGGRIVEGEGEVSWSFAGRSVGVVGIDFARDEVDRLAAIAEAWLAPPVDR